ncbi:MAG: hypothetical protein RIG62_12985 [Cyclobacteriaceae bacterium]
MKWGYHLEVSMFLWQAVVVETVLRLGREWRRYRGGSGYRGGEGTDTGAGYVDSFYIKKPLPVGRGNYLSDVRFS